MPEISVIMPVYNAEKYLAQALDCLKNQTFKDFEAVCINDGSTDSSLDILNRYAQEDSRFKVYTQPNSGQSGGRNTGLDKAAGNFFVFMDNDDLMHPQALEFLIREQKRSGAQIVCHSHRRIPQDGTLEPYAKDEEFKPGRFFDPFPAMCRKKISIMPWSKLYDRTLFDGFRFPKVPLGEDYYTTSVIFSKATKVSVLKNRFYFHRQFPQSQSGTVTPQKASSVFNVARTLLDYFEAHPLSKRDFRLFREYSARYQLYGVFIAAVRQNNKDVLDTFIEEWKRTQPRLSTSDLTAGKRLVVSLAVGGHSDLSLGLYKFLEKIKV